MAASDSHNHAMLGHVSEYFFRYIAGIQQGDGGAAGADPWSAVHIAPQAIPGLDWVDATFDSPAGLVTSRWQRRAAGSPRDGGATTYESDGIEVAVGLPPGVAGRLTLPLSGKVLQLEGGGGQQVVHWDVAPPSAAA